MADTPYPLVWDHLREVDNVQSLGGVVHYFTEDGQTLYLNEGLNTTTTFVELGQWKTSEYSEEIKVCDEPWEMIRFDHPSNGTLYGIASGPNGLEFIRYVYAMDISNLLDSWGWMSQIDNSINQFDCEMYNIGADLFSQDATMFQPGARVTVSIRMGNSMPYQIGVAWLDEVSYDITSETVSMSGRNTIGYYLKDQTFDDETKFSGKITDVVKDILAYAGVNKISVQDVDASKSFEFDPSRTLMDGLQEVMDFYATLTTGMELAELPDGTICLGYYDWVAEKLPKSYYVFNVGREVFTRETTKTVDGAYTALRVTGRDAYGDDLKAVTVPVTNFPYWVLGKHKTNHLTAPDGLTQAQLQSWAETQAKAYQYVGIGEDFSGPFRPQLLVGDVASVINGTIGTNLGIITEVKHSFSRKNGFTTDFSVDSGGVVTDGGNYKIYSRAAELNGFNRRQRIMDLVRYANRK